MKLIVASTNPVKLAAAAGGFAKMFPNMKFNVDGVCVESGVGHQPMNDDATLLGARTRAENGRRVVVDADYYFGIEGGVQERDGELEAFAWIVVISRAGRIGEARTATFQLPKRIAELVRAGVELGEADDQVFGRSNSKQTNGAVGLLTRDVLDRTKYYEQAVVLALIPFANCELYK
jgi:inosine/xanthosine triphosphatase